LSFFRSSGWLFIQFAGERIASALIVILLARIMGPEAFGVSALAVAVPAVFIASARAIVDTVMASASEDWDRLNGVFILSLMLGAAAVAVSMMLSTFIHHMVAPGTLLSAWWVAALVPMVAMVGSVPEGLINARRQFHLAAGRKLAAALVGAAVAIPLSLSDQASFALPAFVGTQATVACVLGFALARWWPVALRMDQLRRSAAADCKLGLSIFLTSICSQTLPRSAEILSGIVLGPAAAGAVRISLQLVETLSGVLYSVSENLILSRASIFRALGSADRAAMVSWTIRTVCFLYSGFFIILSLFAAEIFYLLLGSAWLGYSHVMSALAILGIFASVEFTIRSFQKALSLHKAIYRGAIISAALNAVLMIGGALLFQDSVYAFYILCSLVNAIIAFALMLREVPLSAGSILKALGWPLAAFLIAFAYSLFGHGAAAVVPFGQAAQKVLLLLSLVAVLAVTGWRWRDRDKLQIMMG
jgi:PST family polysaccharide transporter